MARASTTYLNAALNGGLTPSSTTYYVSLHTADPGTTGASECADGGYARKSTTMASAASASQATAASQTFTTAGTTAQSYFGIWSAATAGTYYIGGALQSAVTATSITIASGGITIGGS